MRVTVAIAVALLTVPAYGPKLKPTNDSVLSRVDELLAPHVAMRDFSGTILIARGEQVLVSRGYGFADFEKQIVPDDRTKYCIASITKTMTAAGIELLAARGKLQLDDPVSKHLPDFANRGTITIRQLLEHSSGLKDYYTWPRYASDRADAISQTAFLAELQKQPLDFPPGTKSTYSNSGYFVLAAIIERVSGMSFGDYVAAKLFRPLSINEAANGDAPAKGYDPGFPPSRVQPAASVSRSWLLGSGSVYASARDLHRWLRATRDETIVKIGALPYPYGWGKRSRFGRDLIEQDGRVPIGYASYVALYPSDDLTIVVLSNIQSQVTQQIGVGLAAIALGQPYEIPKLRPSTSDVPTGESASFDAFAGRYEVAPGFVLTVRSVPQGLLVAGPDGAFLPMDHEGGDRFFFRPLYVPIAFARDDAGRVGVLDWAGQFQAKRLD